MPEDVPSPSSGTNASAPANSATQSCTVCAISCECVATSPANRNRTTIGVGEEVVLTVTPGPATWTKASGGGSMVGSSGTSITYRAGDRAETVVINAAAPGAACSITLTVIAPSSMKFEKAAGTPYRHTQNRPDCGWLGAVYLQPDTVSFENCEIREKNSACNATGFYRPFNGCFHQRREQQHSRWFMMDSCVAGKGTPGRLEDMIYSGDPLTGPPWTVGYMIFPIDWEYRVGTGDARAIPAFQQRHDTNTSGQCGSSKCGHLETRVPSDPPSDWPA